MNKKELIKHYEDMSEKLNVFPVVAISRVLKDLRQLNEPEKVTLPKFVVDWIEKIKKELSLREAMSQGYAPHEVDSWLREMDQDGACLNQELFARAWLDGYEVEEKRYTVKIKAVDQYLVSAKDENFLGFLTSKLRTYFTRKELEDVGFGWVFDCPGIEIEEVEG